MDIDKNIKPDQEKKTKAPSRSVFPRIPLNKVLALAEKIYELGEGDPVPRLVVFDKLGKSADSGPSRMLITTSNAYGLTTGSYQAERLGITEHGKAIVSLEKDIERQPYLMETLLANNLFVQFYENYKNKNVPEEAIGVDYLKQVGGLNDSDAKAAYEVFIENFKTYGFTKELSGRLKIVSPEIATPSTKDKVSKNVSETPVTIGKNTEVGEKREENPKAQLNTSRVVPQFNFNIQIQIPDNASAETYDAIFKSIAEHLLKTDGD